MFPSTITRMVQLTLLALCTQVLSCKQSSSPNPTTAPVTTRDQEQVTLLPATNEPKSRSISKIVVHEPQSSRSKTIERGAQLDAMAKVFDEIDNKWKSMSGKLTIIPTFTIDVEWSDGSRESFSFLGHPNDTLIALNGTTKLTVEQTDILLKICKNRAGPQARVHNVDARGSTSEGP